MPSSLKALSGMLVSHGALFFEALSGMLVSHGALFFEGSIRYASESWCLVL